MEKYRICRKVKRILKRALIVEESCSEAELGVNEKYIISKQACKRCKE